MSNNNLQKRVKGCIWGAIIGDALGSRYEFLTSEDAQKQLIDDLKRCNGNLEILGEGPHNLVAGQFTDDSELMLSLLNALIDNMCEYDQDIVAEYYLNWFHSNPFDIGKTTQYAFGNGARDYDDILQNSMKQNQNSKSNGCLMRAMPLALVCLKDPTNLLSILANLDCPLTNPNKECVNAVEIYITAICYSILGEPREKTFERLWEIANNENREILIASVKSQTFNTNYQNMGYYRIALQNALYHFFKRSSFEEAMISTIKLGGDVDTNCSILGGLIGTRAPIPKNWIETVQILEKPHHNRFDKLSFLSPKEIKDTINQFLQYF